ncbi:MAG: AAA family ATPase [Candidatus Sericytochromatia bacterium]|nr:AAA family ATPase [Candidatus Sericytochromatia bacterium]
MSPPVASLRPGYMIGSAPSGWLPFGGSMHCPACGTQGPTNARFCYSCGQSRPEGPTPAHLPDQDMLVVATVVTVMVSGTHVADGVPALLAALVATATEAEGLIVQQDLDRLVIAFGALDPRDDHAVLAVTTTLALQAIIESWQPESAGGDGLVRLGIHSGPVWAERRHGALAVAGTTLHHAWQLALQAKNRQILISEPTCRLVREQVHTAPVPQVLDRSIEAPIAVYELGARRLPSPPAWQTHSPLIGRQRECEQVRTMAAQLRGGHGGVIAITGEAGLGKSRLIAEAKHDLGDDAPSAWLEARAQAWATLRPNGLFADALAALFDVTGEPPLVIQARLAQHMHDRDHQVPCESELPYARRVALLAHLFGVPLSEPSDVGAVGDETALALAMFLRQEALHRNGLVLVFDDVQWADEVSLATLLSLMMMTSDIPLLIVLAYRTDVGLSKRLNTAANWFQEIVLSPLNSEEIRALITARLPAVHLSSGVTEELLVHTAGNPYYIEEVLKALVESGGLPSDGDMWMTTGRFSLPKTVREAAMGRLGNLTPPQRRSLQVASVIGRTFTAAMLRDLLVDAWQDLALAELTRSDLLVSIGDGRYVFRHNLTQEVAYATLTETERAHWHGAVAGWLERQHGHHLSEIVELLAWHYVRAGDGGRPQALGYLMKAAERAMQQGAPQTALHHWQDVLALGKDHFLPDAARARVLSQIGEAFLLTGQTDQAVGAYQAALVLLGSAEQAVVQRKPGADLATLEGAPNNVKNM